MDVSGRNYTLVFQLKQNTQEEQEMRDRPQIYIALAESGSAAPLHILTFLLSAYGMGYYLGRQTFPTICHISDF